MRLASVTLSLTILLSVACAGVRAKSDYDPTIDFRRFETFAWLEPPLREEPRGPEAALADPIVHNTLLDARVREAVEQALAARGYRKSDSGNADFQIRYEIVSRDVTRDSPFFVSSGYGYGYGGRGFYGAGTGIYSSYTYREGTLILDIIDPQTQRIAWRGWAAARTRDGHLDAEKVRRYVEGILKKFPPPEAAKAGNAAE